MHNDWAVRIVELKNRHCVRVHLSTPELMGKRQDMGFLKDGIHPKIPLTGIKKQVYSVDQSEHRIDFFGGPDTTYHESTLGLLQVEDLDRAKSIPVQAKNTSEG